MTPGRRWHLTLIFLWAALHVGAAAAQSRQSSAGAIGQDTHGLRRILFDLHLEPIHSLDEFSNSEPSETVLIILGDTTLLDVLDAENLRTGGMRGWVERGGALLVASDRRLAFGSTLARRFGVRINGGQARWSGEEASERQAYRGLPDCPLASITLPGLQEAAGRRLPLGAMQGLQVATNKPSWLTVEENDLPACGFLPGGLLYGGIPWFARRPFACAGPLGRGKAMVLADHSVFINDMMLQPDSLNFPFAYFSLKWLAEGDPPRTHVLMVEEGRIRTEFNIPVKEPPVPPIPPVEALVPVVNQLLSDLESENAFSETIWQFLGRRRLLFFVFVAASILLAIYALTRLGRSRFRIEPGAPLFANALGRMEASVPALTQQRQFQVETDDYRATAREVAREFLLSLGVDGAARPVVEVQGTSALRRTLRRRVTELWELAYGAAPAPVPARRLKEILKETDELRSALAGGTLRFAALPLTGRTRPLPGRS